MKIGFFTDGYLPQLNGVATTVESMAQALEKRGHQVHIIAPKYPGFKDKRPVTRLTSVKIYKQPDIRLALYFPGMSLLNSMDLDFDIIHGHSGGPVTLLGWEVARMKKIPFVCTYHTLWNHYTHYVFDGKLIHPKVPEVASRIFGNLSDCIIASTPKVKNELNTYGIKKPIVVIPLGIDLTKFHQGKKGYLRKKLNIPSDYKIVLYVGRLGKEKSVDFLVRSFGEVAKEHKKSVFILVGEGPDAEDLKSLAKDLKISDRVFLTGSIDQNEIPEAYCDSDLFVFASKTETQGMVIPEALASGLPVVTIDDPAYRTMVKNNYNGLVVKDSVDKFASAILTLLKNVKLYSKVSENAIYSAESFSVDQTALALEQLYTKVKAKQPETTNSLEDSRSLIS